MLLGNILGLPIKNTMGYSMFHLNNDIVFTALTTDVHTSWVKVTGDTDYLSGHDLVPKAYGANINVDPITGK